MAGRPQDDRKRRESRKEKGTVTITLGNTAQGFSKEIYKEAQIVAIVNSTTLTHVFEVAMLEYLKNHRAKAKSK